MTTLISRHIFLLLLTGFALNGFAQKTCSLESYYASPEVFNTDTVFEKVNIDGQYFTVKVLYDKKNEHLEEVEKLDYYAFSSPSPITLAIYNDSSGKLVYAKKFGSDLPRLYKAGDELTADGKLYLGWFSSGGGSGYTLSTYLVSLQNDQLVLDEVMETNELSYTIYNKNDNEIYLLQGIWGYNGEDVDSEEFETHFSDHRYEIIVYSFSEHGIEADSKGVTKNKYSSEFQDPKELLEEIIRKESLLLYEIDLSEFY